MLVCLSIKTKRPPSLPLSMLMMLCSLARIYNLSSRKSLNSWINGNVTILVKLRNFYKCGLRERVIQSIFIKPSLEKVLQRFGMVNAKVAPTPLSAGYTPTENKEEVGSNLRQTFQSIIGSLLYLMLGTRPDICYAVTKLSQFSANPSQEHLDKAMYIMRYLAGTKHYALAFKGNTQKGIYAYTDSDWAADTIKRRSITGFFFKLADSIFCWRTHAQKTVALSSTEAEYMALSDCS